MSLTREMKHALAILAIMGLAGCGASSGDIGFAASGVVVSSYTDKATGCEYLVYPSGGGITPRLNPDGTQVCEQKEERE